jgi:hypothetical protein
MKKSKSVLEQIQPEKISLTDIKNMDESQVDEMLELATKKLLKAKQQKQMHDMTDAKYYACVVFGNEADKNKWIESLNEDIYTELDTFIDGYQLAKSMGVEIEMTATLPEPHYVKQLKIKKEKKL